MQSSSKKPSSKKSRPKEGTPINSDTQISGADRRGMEASALVDAAKSGDPKAFEELVRRYRPRIFALALHLTGRRSDADDITQDAFLKAYDKIHTFEGRSQFFTWLYRIALHRALNVKRYQKRRRSEDFDDPRVEAAIEVDAGGDPTKAIQLQETYSHLLAAFDKLSPTLRTTVVLTTLQGMSHAEVAVILETTEGTVAWRVHEARKQLKKSMARLLKDPTPQKIQTLGRQIRIAHETNGLDAALAIFLPAIECD